MNKRLAGKCLAFGVWCMGDFKRVLILAGFRGLNNSR